MDTDIVRDFDRCLQGKPAPCTGGCPFSLDIRELLSRLRRGSFGPAYNLLRAAVAFPEVVARLCPAPCRSRCPSALSLPLLERAAIDYSRSLEPARFTLPPREKRVAVVGAGLGGLACALRLAQKQYRVTIFEAQALPSGSARALLPWEVLESELRLQFRHCSCTFLPNSPITDANALAADFDAVYLSSGTALSSWAENVFSAAPCTGPLEGLAAGLADYPQILWYLQTGSKRQEPEQPACSAAPGGMAGSPVLPANGGVYSKAEARQEAARCGGCDCTRCIDHCVLLQQYGRPAPDLARDVGVSTNLFHETQGHAAMREIGSCSNCGLCKAVCPVGIDIGQMMLEARRILRDKRELPQAHHEYWLRDMAFANGPHAAAACLPPDTPCTELFFPGCQSGGSDPRYVSLTYRRLLERNPGTGLLLRCCGAPALWAGEQALFRSQLEEIRQFWLEAGKPRLILSCPSCFRTLSAHLPEIPMVMLYELPQLQPAGSAGLASAAVFDPCASRPFPYLQEAVRRLARESGIALEELPGAGTQAQCCSWGGHGYCVNPLYIRQQVSRQRRLSELPYLCYCTNCRDILAADGKDCRHILDCILDVNREPRPAPTVTQRRENRRALKRTLAAQYGLPCEQEVNPSMTLTMTPAVARKLSDDLILEEDLQAVIAACETTGVYLENPENGHRIGHKKLGYLTYWVEYAPVGPDAYAIHNAYTHRMHIKHEETSSWN